MEIGELRTVPTAGLLGKKAASDAQESAQIGRAGIQAGAQAVTKTAVHGPGYGPGELPEKMFVPERVRLERELKNFKKWVKATGEFERLEGTPERADLVNEIRKRLDAYLASRRSQT